jgi:hypothetical protein
MCGHLKRCWVLGDDHAVVFWKVPIPARVSHELGELGAGGDGEGAGLVVVVDFEAVVVGLIFCLHAGSSAVGSWRNE